MSEPTNALAHDAGQVVPLRSLSAAEALEWMEANADAVGAAEFPARLSVAEIETVDVLLQPRSVAEWHVSDMVAGIKAGRALPPVLVYRVGGRNLLLDGHHRLEAYRVAKVAAPVPVEFFKGMPSEAVLEARARNSATKLPMSSAERHDDAWRLVKLARHSKAEVCKAANVSKGSVDAMRRALKALGVDEAAECRSWRLARARADGKEGGQDMTEERRQQWLDELADGWADRLAKTFGTKMSNQPEIAAQALARHFGRRLPELARHLREHLPEDDSEGDF